jgi:hypothetical protein
LLLDDTLKKTIRAAPIYTPVLVGRWTEKTTAIFVRVDSLKTFKPAALKIQASFTGYEHEGVYLACIAFRVFGTPISSFMGDGYLNLRQEADRRALEYLTTQEHLPFVFLSFDLKSQLATSVPWMDKNREAALEILERSGSIAAPIVRSVDPVFQRLKGRFQALYSVRDLLPIADAGRMNSIRTIYLNKGPLPDGIPLRPFRILSLLQRGAPKRFI